MVVLRVLRVLNLVETERPAALSHLRAFVPPTAGQLLIPPHIRRHTSKPWAVDADAKGKEAFRILFDNAAAL